VVAGPLQEGSRFPRHWQGRRLAWAIGLSLAVLFVVWAPYLSRIDLLMRHFDGPNYLVVAKTFYRVTGEDPLPGYIADPRYFAVHLPGFPLLLRGAAILFGWQTGFLVAVALGAVASAAAFNIYAARALPSVKVPVALLAFLLLPARHTLYRSLGSTEDLMAFAVFAALAALDRGLVGWAYAAAALATVTRINGLLLVAVVALTVLRRGRPAAALLGAAAAVAPLGGVLLWHQAQFGSALTFLEVHGGKPGSGPFSYILERASAGDWVAAELLLSLFLLHALGAGKLWVMGRRPESVLVALHIGLFAFLRETDLARYFLTVTPLCIVVAWPEVWSRRGVSFVLLGVLGALSISYAWETIPMNVCHPAAWSALLRFLGS
jgi:hypothetical protein